MKPVRVLHVVGAMNRGGAEAMVMTLYRNIDRAKVQFDFLEFSKERSQFTDEIAALGGRIIKVKWSQSPREIFQTIGRISRAIRKNGPYEAVHSHLLFASGTVMLAAKIAGIKKRIAHGHSTSAQDGRVIARGYRLFSRFLIRVFGTNYVACGEEAGNYLFGKVRSNDRKFAIIPNGVDIKTFFPSADSSDLRVRKSLGFMNGELILLSVARFEPVKNHKFLIEISQALDASGINFKMIFVGDGSLREILEKEVERNDLGSRVHFFGVRTDIPDLMRAADFLLMPSLYEGLPVSLVEAQATGLTCIVSDRVTQEADLGLDLVNMLPINDPKTWAQYIVSFERTKPSAAQIEDNLVAKGYTAEGAVDRLQSVYQFDVI